MTETADLLTGASAALLTLDASGLIAAANPAACELIGVPASEIAGHPLRELVELGDRPLREGASAEMLRLASGGRIAITLQLVGLGASSNMLGIVSPYATGDDASEGPSSLRLARVLEHVRDVVVGTSPDGVMRIASASVTDVLGYEASAVIGHPWMALVHPDDQPRALGHWMLTPDEPLIARCRTADGEDRQLRWSRTSSVGDDMVVLVGHDPTAAREAVQTAAHVDPLTGCATRRSIRQVLEQALAAGGVPALVLLDLDHFKAVNDGYGHRTGDSITIAVGHRLTETVGQRGIVGHADGGTFCIAMSEGASEPDLATMAEELRRSIGDTPISADNGMRLIITGSVGAAASSPSPTVESLFDAAERALSSAKARGRNRVRLASELTSEDALDSESIAIRLARSIALAVGVRRSIPFEHAEQVAELAGRIAQRLRLPQVIIVRTRLAGLLHDVGMIGVPDSVLVKPEPLEPDEREIVEAHTIVGEEIVRATSELADAAAGVRGHHERWDGQGYPDRRAGDAIPIEARIVAVVDAYCAMTRERVYRTAVSPAEAIEELQRCAGMLYDPRVVAALIDIIGEFAPVKLAA